MKETLMIIIALFAVGSCTYFGPNIKEHFGIRYRDADRKIFKRSLPYIDGTIQTLTKLKMEHATADSDAHKAAISQMAIDEANRLGHQHLPHNLKTWINSLGGY